MTLEGDEVIVMLVGTNGTGRNCGIRGVMLETGERAEDKAVEMGRRGMESRIVVYMASTGWIYHHQIKVAHRGAVREYTVTSSRFACTAVALI